MAVFSPVGSSNTTTNVTNTPNTVEVPTIANETVAVANVEQAYPLPALSKRFSIKNRGVGRLQVAYGVGQSGTLFLTVPASAVYTVEELSTSAAIVIYYQCSVAGAIIEIVSWA